MTTTNILNILINQGSDFELTFQLAHKCITRCPVKPSLVPSTIKIEPMGVTLPIGSILIVGCDDLVLSAPMSPNDRVISVTSIPSSIPNNTVIQGPSIDLTGWTIRSSVKDRSGQVLCNLIGTISDPLLGIFKVTLSSAVSTLVKSNCNWQDYQGIDITSLGQNSDIKSNKLTQKLLKNSYLWDLETIDTASIVNRRFEGLALVSGEVTT